MQGKIRTFHGGKRERDLEDTRPAGETKKRITDSHREDSKRMDATKAALDMLLKPNNSEQTPREQEVYQQSIEELNRLNKGDYAINAHNDEELALSAARRAHLKALTFPGDFSDKQKNDWKPGGKWALWAKTSEKYEQQVDRTERKRQQLEKECPIATLNKAINSSELKNAISTYKEESQQDKRKYCQILKAKLGTIRDYLEGEQIGIAKADFAWNEIKDEQKQPKFIAIVDLRQLLNLPHQETTSSLPDQGSHALMTQETVPPDVEMKSPHYALAQQHFEQSRQQAEDMLKALPDNEFKKTSQARYDALITTYTTMTMTPDTVPPSQLQDVYTKMKILHNELAQQHFEQSRQQAEDMLKALPDNEFKKTSQARFDALITTYTAMTPDTALQDVYTQMTELHKDLIQQDVETIQAWFQKIDMPDFPAVHRNTFNNLQQKYQNNSSFGQQQDAHHQMVNLHMEVLQWHFEKYQSLIQKIRRNIVTQKYAEFENLVQEHGKMPYDGTIPLHKQQMVNLHDRMMHFYQKQAADLFESAQVYVNHILVEFSDDSFLETCQEKYDDLMKIYQENAPLYQLQDTLDKMITLHHDVTLWFFQKSKANIEILLDLTQQDHFRMQFQSQESTWNMLESERNDRVHLDSELTIIDELLKVENSLIQTFYKQQINASINDLLGQFNSSEFKTQFKELEHERQKLELSWNTQELEWEKIEIQEEQRDNLDQRHTTVRLLLNYHNRLASTIYEQTQSRIQQLLAMLPEDAFKQTSQTKHTNLIEKRPQGNIPTDQSLANDNWRESAKSSQTWQGAVKDLRDLHSDLAQEAIKQTHASVEQLLQLFQMKPQAEFEALTKRCREDLFSPNTRPAESQADKRPIGDWQKNEKNTEARANDWQEMVKGMEDFHTRLANSIYEQTQKEVLLLITQMPDSSEKRWYQEDFGAQQTEYKESTNPGQKQLVLHRMADTHKDLLPLDFQRHHSYIQYSLHHHIKDPQRKTEYQTRLDELQTSYSKSLNLDRQRWQQGLHEIIVLRYTVSDHAWKDLFQQLQANIEQRLQTLQEDVVEDKYRESYAQLKQNYDKLSHGGQKLGTSSETRECYEKMALFYKDLLGVSEMNRRHYELKDDTKEIEHYTNELEEGL